MKTLIILSLTIVSLNAFSADVGEDKKADCKFANQSAKRDAKIVEAPVEETKKEATKTISK